MYFSKIQKNTHPPLGTFRLCSIKKVAAPPFFFFFHSAKFSMGLALKSTISRLNCEHFYRNLSFQNNFQHLGEILHPWYDPSPSCSAGSAGPIVTPLDVWTVKQWIRQREDKIKPLEPCTRQCHRKRTSCLRLPSQAPLYIDQSLWVLCDHLRPVVYWSNIFYLDLWLAQMRSINQMWSKIDCKHEQFMPFRNIVLMQYGAFCSLYSDCEHMLQNSVFSNIFSVVTL